MRTARLGALDVSVIGLGCNNFGRALDLEGSVAVVEAALDNGITFFDTAANYGNGQSESFLGQALRNRRDEAIIATKFGMPRPDESRGGASPEYMRASAERSLAALRTDVIDLYQLHKPDPDVPIAETLGALWELVDAGLVREIGCSNLDAGQLEIALAAATQRGGRRFVSNQVEYSLIHRAPDSDGLTDVCLSEGVALLPYYPLANGLLTGKVTKGVRPEGRLNLDRYQRYLTDENYAIADVVVGFARTNGIEPAQLALAWLLSRPAVPAVTPGATRVEQVVSNVQAASVDADAVDFAELQRLVSSC